MSKRATRLPAVDCEILLEPDSPSHPLCGVIAALRHAKGRAVLAIGCDMPFLTGQLLHWMAGLEGTVAISLDGRLEPLPARWAAAHLTELEQALEHGAPMRRVLESLPARTVGRSALRRFGDPHTLCFNVNDNVDLAHADALPRAAP